MPRRFYSGFKGRARCWRQAQECYPRDVAEGQHALTMLGPVYASTTGALGVAGEVIRSATLISMIFFGKPTPILYTHELPLGAILQTSVNHTALRVSASYF
ncbi:hypothetical protein EON83_23970 [bacterium]|nr:MAG: hypothetical protein EON83_23970 [bacterium]